MSKLNLNPEFTDGDAPNAKPTEEVKEDASLDADKGEETKKIFSGGFFSDIFDSGWELNSNKGYSLYSLINGFWIDGDGEYDLYFAPQKYIVPGLIVSLTTLTSCIIFLVCSKKFS